MIKVINKQESFSPKLSCFWFMKNELYGDEIKIKDATQSGDYIIDSSLHYFLWDSVKNLDEDFKDKSYEYYPRGRVRFNTRINQCEVFADKKIVNSNLAKNKICQELGLPPTTIFMIDEHYESIGDID